MLLRRRQRRVPQVVPVQPQRTLQPQWKLAKPLQLLTTRLVIASEAAASTVLLQFGGR
jgi:hypothetical protein